MTKGDVDHNDNIMDYLWTCGITSLVVGEIYVAIHTRLIAPAQLVVYRDPMGIIMRVFKL